MHSHSGDAVNLLSMKRIALVERLIAKGMPATQAAAKSKLFASAADRLRAGGVNSGSGLRAFYVPGRIEFLGKHTDYAGGRCLICAVDRGFCIVAVPRSDSIVRVIGETEDSHITFKLDPEIMPVVGHWSNYPMTAGRRVARNFPGPLLGADIAFTSDLPASSGLSSSSALIISFFLCLSAINQLHDRAEYRNNIKNNLELAGYLGTIENGQTFGTLEGDRGVGTFGGSEDHTAILTASPGELSQYSFCPVRHERQIPLPAAHSLVIGVSGVIAEKTGGVLHSYNNAAFSARAVLDQWRKTSGRDDATLAAAVASTGSAILQSLTQKELIDRLNQFVAESTQIIPAAGDALIAGKLTELGTLIDRSQDLADRLLKNQVPETVYLAKTARECGAIAATSFGAGFGGSVWSLVRNAEIESFIAAWQEKYQTAFVGSAERGAFFATTAGVPAVQLS